MSKAADRVWNALVSLVMDTRNDWRRQVSEATGLPFGRVRALRRLYDGPLALHELADAMGSDAAAATVAVNYLEKRGLVVRKAHPTNRRSKIVSLTPKGREVVARGKAVTEHAPPAFAALPPAALASLGRVIEQTTK
jgi:DNA-binding MarR family transcriptional regulator